ncbi:DUF3800 domain-containing protein [Paraburkholderia sp. RL18-103-BIB-C]|jgi:hypothetical protein|uniref:DUF3800 domain-containing protein n=1 Tax=unclassified Paraburkholderia TaxID=2615204 RepID=UPI0038B73313
MQKTEYHFYMDDSGARDPDRSRDASAKGPDWFALGGLLIKSDDEDAAKAAIKAFRERWTEMADAPLRSYDIRNKTKRFRWLDGLTKERYSQFMHELTTLIVSLPIHVLACVIDRPGYNKRYMEQYGDRRWKLCRTAFTIAVERAAKVALHDGIRLRVYLERSDKPTEQQFKGYFDEMRQHGLPFNAGTSLKYRPLTVEQLHSTLFEFRIKTKESVLMQFADLVLWPVCCGGYDKAHRAYAVLAEAGKLLDIRCTDDNGLLGTKYSCFE